MSMTKEETERFLELQKVYNAGDATKEETLEYFTIICGGDESEAQFMIARNLGNLPDSEGEEVYKY